MRSVGWRSDPRGKHQVVVLPLAAPIFADLVLPDVMEAQRVDAALRQLNGPTRLPGLGVPAGPWDNEFCVLETEFPELPAKREPWSP
jgi:hypothetical protein